MKVTIKENDALILIAILYIYANLTKHGATEFKPDNANKIKQYADSIWSELQKTQYAQIRGV